MREFFSFQFSSISAKDWRFNRTPLIQALKFGSQLIFANLPFLATANANQNTTTVNDDHIEHAPSDNTEHKFLVGCGAFFGTLLTSGLIEYGIQYCRKTRLRQRPSALKIAGYIFIPFIAAIGAIVALDQTDNNSLTVGLTTGGLGFVPLLLYERHFFSVNCCNRNNLHATDERSPLTDSQSEPESDDCCGP